MNIDIGIIAILVTGAIAGVAFLFVITKRPPAYRENSVQYGMIAVASLAVVAVLGLFSIEKHAPAPKTEPSSSGGPIQASVEYLAEVFLLARDDPIRQVYNSFGLIILNRRDGPKSRAICSAMLNYYYRGVYSPTRRLDDVVYRIKPIYWPIISREPNYSGACNYLLAYYDLSRADAIKDRLGLATEGPFLVTARFSDGPQREVAAVVVYDLSSVPNDEVLETFSQYLDAYVSNKRLASPVAATGRQRLKSTVLAFSEPVARLFGVERAKP